MKNQVKVKAIELIDTFLDYVNCWNDFGNADYTQAETYAKYCALAAIDEILIALESDNIFMKKRLKFYEEVKQEIFNL